MHLTAGHGKKFGPKQEEAIAALLPASGEVGLFRGEAGIVKVRLHVDSVFDHHCIDEAMPTAFCCESRYPVALLKTRALTIGRTYAQCTNPKRVRRKAGIFRYYVSAERRH